MGWFARMPRVRRPAVAAPMAFLSLTAVAVSITAGPGVAGTLRAAQPPQLAVSLTGLNPGNAHDRSLCLAFALVPGAASECADLRVTHGLPATMSKGTVQAPTLCTTAPSRTRTRLCAPTCATRAARRPDSIEAILKVNGVERRRGMWSGAPMTLNVPLRLALGYDAIPSGSGDATGRYPYTIEVAAFVGGTKGATTTVSDTFVLVNRCGQQRGPRLVAVGVGATVLQGDGSLLWVGGDGSARHYRARRRAPASGAPTSLARPDTITLRKRRIHPPREVRGQGAVQQRR